MTVGGHEWLGLRVTPLVFAAVFALGAWATPTQLFGLWSGNLTRAAFVFAAITSVWSAVHPSVASRLVALAAGSWAAISRGMTLLTVGSAGSLLPRKAEIIGGGVWMAVAYFALFVWIVTVPAASGRQIRRDR